MWPYIRDVGGCLFVQTEDKPYVGGTLVCHSLNLDILLSVTLAPLNRKLGRLPLKRREVAVCTKKRLNFACANFPATVGIYPFWTWRGGRCAYLHANLKLWAQLLEGWSTVYQANEHIVCLVEMGGVWCGNYNRPNSRLLKTFKWKPNLDWLDRAVTSQNVEKLKGSEYFPNA
jgi:hypothetical protein